MRTPVMLALMMCGLLEAPIALAGQSSAPDVCTLLPRDEALKLLGRAGPARTRAVKRSDGDAMECRYMIGAAGTITVTVGANVSKRDWDESMKILRSSGANLEAVTGIGDGAFFWDTRLYAHAATYEIVVDTNPSPGDVTSKVKADAVILARAVAAKLKR